MELFEDKLQKLQEMINNSRHIVFFWWAWVSTESWIPDFRSKDGLYNQHDVEFENYQPEYLLSHTCLYNEPKVFFEYYRQKLDCRNIKPNKVHIILAELEKSGKLSSIITQNIDGLHQKAWSKNVLEVHGTTQRAYCSTCFQQYDPEILFTDSRPIPFCKCWGIIRPDVTLYEEPLPTEVRLQSIKEIQQSDLFIIWGTSLIVYPANTLIQYFRWKHLVIINKEKTPQDTLADIVFHENLWKVLWKIKV